MLETLLFVKKHKNITSGKLRFILLPHDVQGVQVKGLIAPFPTALLASSDPLYLSPAAHGLLPWRRTTLREQLSVFHLNLFPFYSNQTLNSKYSELFLGTLWQTGVKHSLTLAIRVSTEG